MIKTGKFLLFLVLTSILFFSCKKEKTSPNAQGQAEFSVGISQLKSLSGDTIASNLAYVIVSIEDANGNTVKNSEKIELYNMSGNYISKPLGLLVGNYKLTRFLVLDRNNNVVYASPMVGSAKAYLVKNPLAISFSVSLNTVTKVVPEVLKAIDSKPEDFGYASFGFEIAKTFDFLLGVFIYNPSAQNFGLTTAQLKITSNSALVYEGPLNAYYSEGNGYDSLAITNKITLPERYTTFTVEVTKLGYASFVQTFSKEDLRKYFSSIDNGPLVVILKEMSLFSGLVAYYKFNGDVKDYSGNNNDGTYYGGVFGTGRKGDSNGAIALNGSSDYVLLKNSSSLNLTKQISICAWYYATPFYGNGTNAVVTKQEMIDSKIKYQFHLCITGSYYPNATSSIGFVAGNIPNNLGINTSGYGSETIPFNYTYFTYSAYNWYFIVGTYDGQFIKLYINGVLNAWRSKNGDLEINNNDVFIGKSPNEIDRPNNDYLKGKIDEVRIYNRALSPEEIISLYNE